MQKVINHLKLHINIMQNSIAMDKAQYNLSEDKANASWLLLRIKENKQYIKSMKKAIKILIATM